MIPARTPVLSTVPTHLTEGLVPWRWATKLLVFFAVKQLPQLGYIITDPGTRQHVNFTPAWSKVKNCSSSKLPKKTISFFFQLMN
jgi:hypothetical protein